MAKPTKAEIARRAAAEELVRLRAKNAAVYAREKELKAVLIEVASENGDNFKEVIEGVGAVKVSAPKDKRCKGTAPEIVVDTFLAMTEGQRDKLIERGVVKIVEQWTSPYYGAVTVDLF